MFSCTCTLLPNLNCCTCFLNILYSQRCWWRPVIKWLIKIVCLKVPLVLVVHPLILTPWNNTAFHRFMLPLILAAPCHHHRTLVEEGGTQTIILFFRGTEMYRLLAIFIPEIIVITQDGTTAITTTCHHRLWKLGMVYFIIWKTLLIGVTFLRYLGVTQRLVTVNVNWNIMSHFMAVVQKESTVATGREGGGGMIHTETATIAFDLGVLNLLKNV